MVPPDFSPPFLSHAPRLIERGEERRRYAHTRWNEYSSRSHVLFNLTLEKLSEPNAASQCEGPAPHPPAHPRWPRPVCEARVRGVRISESEFLGSSL